MGKSLKRNYFYNILLNISKVIFPLITAPYISRVLEPDGVGLFNFANTYSNYFALVAALGIPLYGVREVAKIKDDIQSLTKFVSEIISLSCATTFVTTLIYVCSVFFIPQLSKDYIIFLLIALGLYTTPFAIDWYFRGREEFGYITLRALIVRTASVIALFLFVHNKSDLIIYVTIYAFSTITNEIWNFIKMYQHGVHPYFTLSGIKHLRSLTILFSSSIAISIYTILDTLMLGFMSNYSEVGYYNCATHISRSFTPIVTSLSAVAMPRLASYIQENKKEEIQAIIDKSFSIVSFLSFPIAFGVAAIAPIFVPLFFGHLYYGAIIPLQIVVLVVVAVGLNNITGVQILLGLGYDKLFLYSVLSGTITNFLLNLLFIPLFGASGAAFSSVIAEFVILFVMMVFIIKKTDFCLSETKSFFINLLISLGFFVIVNYLSNVVDGWYLVVIFAAVGTIYYVGVQYMIKNKAVIILANVIKYKKNKN